jgi:hypothetical protein
MGIERNFKPRLDSDNSFVDFGNKVYYYLWVSIERSRPRLNNNTGETVISWDNYVAL